MFINNGNTIRRGRWGPTAPQGVPKSEFFLPPEPSLLADLTTGARSFNHAEEYPMYVLPVRELLKLSSWRPHQELLAEGLLVRVTDKLPTSTAILFASHQWTAFTHPDPSGEQLRTLQQVLVGLREGRLRTETSAFLELGYNYHRHTTQEEWAQLLDEGLLWIDYFSVPQPLAASTHAAPPRELRRQSTHSDHRVAASADPLVEQLKAAVASIPSYVERSTLMLAFVPPVPHADLDGVVCDFHSWRSRGWCRMEMGAASLADRELPVLVVKDALQSPEFICPTAFMGMPAAKGNFSVQSDRDVVLAVLQRMVDAKAAHYEASGELTLMRLLLCFAPLITGGVATAYRTRYGGAASLDATAALRSLLRWRDDATEAAWEEESGWNLLTCACLLDDVDAVTALLAAPGGADAVRAIGKPHPNALKTSLDTPPQHRTPFAQLLFRLGDDHMPLAGAMGFSRPDVVRALCAAGAPLPPAIALDIVAGSPVESPTGALVNGRLDNLEALIEYHPHLDMATLKGTRCAVYEGSVPLHIAASIESSGEDMLASVRWLLARGAVSALGTQTISGVSPIAMLASNSRAEAVEAMRLMREAAGESACRRALNTPERPWLTSDGIWRMMALMARLGIPHGVLMLRIREEIDIGGRSTVLHRAVDVGSQPMAKLLVAMGADTNATDARGDTPIERARQRLPACSCSRVASTLEGASPPKVLARGGPWHARARAAVAEFALEIGRALRRMPPVNVLAAAATWGASIVAAVRFTGLFERELFAHREAGRLRFDGIGYRRR